MQIVTEVSRRVCLCLHLIISTMLVLCPVSTAAQVSNPVATNTPKAPEQAVQIDPAPSDTAIEQRIESILNATGWYSEVGARVDEGVVFLDGVTATEAYRTWARDLASKTDGVVAIVNRITVREVVIWSLAPALEELENVAQKTVAALPLIVLAVLV
ncbi:hypothetical protein ROLI_044630 [Roseobacter fucihabitans]|uniref:BON domain-containing protein n=1 Tax=Roseobacter fucihabitans TaxID=1537242 RepID=A0ABZ2BZU9_9RHOB|nr:BON domain-containing protein [Roseobacter litoralis]MBC6963942.1 BON domain protein [Roseobacter litoralis]MBC6963973.1 BON domain protein [Roseobacter litoralis]